MLRPATSPVNLLRAELARPERAPVRRGVAPFLHERLVVDRPDLRRFVTRADLAAWDVRPEAAYGVAHENLPATGLRMGDNGLWELASGDGYESSRLLLPGWLAAFRGRVPGRPVAVVPHARGLFVGGDADHDLVRELLTIGPRAWRDEGDPISPVPYTIDDRGAIVPWAPGPQVPPLLRASVHAASRALASREYARQAEVLDDFDEVPATAYEVALAPAGADDVRLAYGFCRWTRGQDARLPEVDVVVLAAAGHGAVLAVPWEAFVRFAGAHLVAEPLSPPRWRTRGWPDATALKALERASLRPDQLG